MAVVGVQVLAVAHLQQLFKVADATVLALGALYPQHGARQAVELHGVAGNVGGLGQHPADGLAQYRRQVVFPALFEGVAGGHHHFPVVDLQRQHTVALGKGEGHDRGHLGHVDLERVDVLVGQIAVPGQPLHQKVLAQTLARALLVLQLEVGNMLDRVHRLAVALGGKVRQPAEILHRDMPLLLQQLEQTLDGQRAGQFLRRFRHKENPAFFAYYHRAGRAIASTALPTAPASQQMRGVTIL